MMFQELFMKSMPRIVGRQQTEPPFSKKGFSVLVGFDGFQRPILSTSRRVVAVVQHGHSLVSIVVSCSCATMTTRMASRTTYDKNNINTNLSKTTGSSIVRLRSCHEHHHLFVVDPAFNQRRLYSSGGDSAVSSNPTKTTSTTTTAATKLRLMDRYQAVVDQGLVHYDSHQVEALEELERLRSDLLSYKLPPRRNVSTEQEYVPQDSSDGTGSFSGWFGFGGGENTSNSGNKAIANALQSANLILHPSSIKGVYLHGGVGSGKTMLMNLFYDSLTQEPWVSEKQKIHYHKFMAMIHKQMHQARNINSTAKQNVSDAVLPAVIRQTAQQGRLLCLDEFQVTDVADALILQRLFTGLWQQEGCIVVATSNRAPVDLYLGGLQRDRFLPFIKLLQESCQEVSLWDSDVDYRLIQKVESGQVASLWFVGHEGKWELDQLFNTDLIDVDNNNTAQPMELSVSTDSQRTIHVPLANTKRRIGRFSFASICQKPLSASDYLVIGHEFSTIVVDQIPTLTLNELNWVRRFILLVDAMYESNVKLVLHCQEATQASEIFVIDDKESTIANHDEVFAFDRTISRLQEMSSRSYLHRKWTGRK